MPTKSKKPSSPKRAVSPKRSISRGYSIEIAPGFDFSMSEDIKNLYKANEGTKVIDNKYFKEAIVYYSFIISYLYKLGANEFKPQPKEIVEKVLNEMFKKVDKLLIKSKAQELYWSENFKKESLEYALNF